MSQTEWEELELEMQNPSDAVSEEYVDRRPKRIKVTPSDITPPPPPPRQHTLKKPVLLWAVAFMNVLMLVLLIGLLFLNVHTSDQLTTCLKWNVTCG